MTRRTVLICPECQSREVEEISSVYGTVVVKCKDCEHSANAVHFVQVVNE